MITGVRPPWIVLTIVLMLPAMSAIADTGPSDFGAVACAAGVIPSPAGSADAGERAAGQRAGNGVADRAPPLSLIEFLVVAGLGLMFLAGINSRKRRRRPPFPYSSRNQHEQDQISQGTRSLRQSKGG